MKRIIVLLAVVFLSLVISAHEFWLQPDKFIYQWGDRINVKLLVGENFEGDNWNGNNKSIESLQLYLNEVTDDLSDQIGDVNGDSLQFSVYEEGTYMITYHSMNKHIELKPAEFLAYLEEDGLNNAIEYRRQHNETDSFGREHYQRSVKTIFQVGDEKTDVFENETSLPLDIIPLTNPYLLENGDSLSVKILFMHEPLANSLIKLWTRNDNKTEKQEYISNEHGEIRFAVNTNGTWMVSTVKMVRLDGDPQVDWQSYWGSLTWGYVK